MKQIIRNPFALPIALLFLCAGHSQAVTNDPVIAELLPKDSSDVESYGSSVSIFNNTLAIGAPGADINVTDSGAVYIYTRTDTSSWQEQAVLVAENGNAGDHFGASVSAIGDTIVVGAAGDDDKGEDSGAVYVFVRSGTTWQLQAKLVADDGAAGDNFGHDVVIGGNTIVVGAPYDDNKGSAYTFYRSSGAWEQQSKILAYGTRNVGDRFGCSVDIGYSLIVVGADGDDNSATDDGSAFVYYPYGSGWRYQKKLVASDASIGDQFGWSVAVGLDKALIGTNRTQADGVLRPGAAYAFLRNSSTWTQKQQFHGANESIDDGFGSDVAIYDNFYVIGAPREKVNNLISGAVYLFSRSKKSAWPLHAKYVPQNGTSSDQFGAAVSIFGDIVITGIPGRGTGTAQSYMYPCGLGRYLPEYEWLMISSPCHSIDPGSTLLGDDLAGGIYSTTWTLYRSDYSKATGYNPYGYFKLGETESLSEGVGYWIYSVTDGILEVNGSVTPTVDSVECRSLNGCVEIPLKFPKPGQRYYNNMVGNPFAYAIDWSDVLVKVYPSDRSAPLTMTPSEAYEQKFLRSSVYYYESNRYSAFNDITPGKRGTIMPFESVWVHTLDPNGHSFPALEIKLLVPAVGPFKSTTP